MAPPRAYATRMPASGLHTVPGCVALYNRAGLLMSARMTVLAAIPSSEPLVGETILAEVHAQVERLAGLPGAGAHVAGAAMNSPVRPARPAAYRTGPEMGSVCHPTRTIDLSSGSRRAASRMRSCHSGDRARTMRPTGEAAGRAGPLHAADTASSARHFCSAQRCTKSATNRSLFR
jgi:hypothetical protein